MKTFIIATIALLGMLCVGCAGNPLDAFECSPPAGKAVYTLKVTEREGSTCHIDTSNIEDQAFENGAFVYDTKCAATGELSAAKCGNTFTMTCTDKKIQEDIVWNDHWEYASGTIVASTDTCTSTLDVVLTRKLLYPADSQ